MSKKRLLSLFVGIFLGLGLAFSGVLNVFAQESQVGLTITPLTFEISANPGTAIENKVEVSNPTQNTINVSMEVEDFSALGEEGGVAVGEQENEIYSLKKWVTTTPKTFTLASGAKKVVTFRVDIPENAEPGGKYATILASVTGVTGPKQSGATINPKVGSLLLVSVSGPIEEDVQVKDFSVPGFISRGPVPLVLRLLNEGTVHEKPTGVITVTDIFGNEVAKVNVPQKNVLPGAVRKVETQLKNQWLWGIRYRATLSGSYGSQNTPLTASVDFWAFPWQIALPGLIILIIVVWLIARTNKKIKKANQVLKEKEGGQEPPKKVV